MCSGLPDTLCLIGIWVCSPLAPALQAVEVDFSLEFFLPSEWGGDNNCKHLQLKFQCRATRSGELCEEEFSTQGCGCSGATTQRGVYTL